MNEYKASNGVEIRDDGGVLKWRTTTYPIWEPVGSGVPDMAGPGFARDSLIGRALAEFFQHERDEELGRWRWPENPDYVVYARATGLLALNEQTGNSKFHDIRVNRITGRKGGSVLDQALTAYFEAHHEPKPWHDAKPGEVWALSVEGEEIACIVTPSGPDFEPVAHPVWATVARGSDRITSGRRIWPIEGVS